MTQENIAEEELLIGALLRIPYTAVTEALERELREAGYKDVRAAHFSVLQPLASRPKGMRTTDLAAWAQITKPSIVYLVDHLEVAGYVERTADPTDGRAQQVRLTAKGWDVTRTARKSARQVEVDWEDRLGTTQMRQFKQTLRNLIASFQRDPL
jgi:DNA-binding MarR family transcriptional regulator